VVNYGLGRLPARDDRDNRYLLRSLVPLEAVQRRNKHWALFAGPLDQGNTGTCVEHGWRHWGMAAPVISTKKLARIPQYALYDEMIAIDEWSDNDIDPRREFGTSVRAGARIFQQRGFLTVYGWVFEIETAIDWLVSQGALVFGTNWLQGMNQTDASGFVYDTGRVLGGHCYTAIGWSETRGAMRFINSWGSGFGEKGRFWMTGETVDRLLRANGEACSSVELRGVS